MDWMISGLSGLLGLGYRVGCLPVCCCGLCASLLLWFVCQSVAVLCAPVCCCGLYASLLLCFVCQSVAVLCAPVCCCALYASLLLCFVCQCRSLRSHKTMEINRQQSFVVAAVLKCETDNTS
ncbi:hypothetical protein FPQ18DRAFT_132313 [Pyronema domesticum]|nr:hypothetical protein FPQ18DRAFT_132313 [Pyronema domesticum]